MSSPPELWEPLRHLGYDPNPSGVHGGLCTAQGLLRQLGGWIADAIDDCVCVGGEVPQELRDAERAVRAATRSVAAAAEQTSPARTGSFRGGAS